MDKGAHYFKTDLQVHTPRDPAWSGSSAVTSEQRQAWASELVATCRAKRIGAVAITDHHDFVMLSYIRAAAQNETDERGEALPSGRQLVVFPGLELTLAALCQALLILDAEFPADRLQTLLDVLAIDATDASEAHYRDTVPIGIDDLGNLHARLEEHDWLRGRFAILPNVGDGAHGTLIRKGWAKKYIDMPCVGGYVERKVPMPGSGNHKILTGQDKSWGNKSIAVINTSDARSLEALGEHSTWIKWAEPTAEALRQACLAEESRIDLEEPRLPSVVITALHVSNSQFMGPIDLDLNPQYNAFIGGRGTGKSTCLEYLRWALCDQPPSGGDGESDYSERRKRLITNTLQPPNGQVEVHFLLNGIPHIVRRRADTGEVMLKVGSEALSKAVPQDIRSLLPIEAYGQKQLSSVGIRLDELLRFITAPIRDALDDIGSREAQIAGELRENYAQLERYRALSQAIARDKFTIDSLTQQAAKLRDSLGGLSDEDRARISAKPRYDEADQVVSGWARRLEQANAETAQLRTSLSRLLEDVVPLETSEMPEADDLQELAGHVRAAISALDAAIGEANAKFESDVSSGSELDRLTHGWRKSYGEFTAAYSAAAERSSAQKSKLSELTALETRQRDLQTTLSTQQDELVALGDPIARHADLRSKWRAIQAERCGLLQVQCEQLTELSDGLIRAHVERGAGTARLLDPFKAAVAGSGLQATKIENFLRELAQLDDPIGGWHSALDELEQALLADDKSGRAAFQSKLSVFSGGDIDRILSRLDPRAAMELGLLQLDDHPSFAYRVREDDYIAFKDASAGQQATALLRVLLSQEGPPLLIDQPEDDLDSKVIQEVVEQVWAAKHRRQLIFSSHNANLVVNGDAELVICCDYRTAGDHSGGRVKIQGAIDIPAVRDVITDVMEGGEKAFRLRKDKYGF
jgi:type III restriction enzyme